MSSAASHVIDVQLSARFCAWHSHSKVRELEMENSGAERQEGRPSGQNARTRFGYRNCYENSNGRSNRGKKMLHAGEEHVRFDAESSKALSCLPGIGWGPTATVKEDSGSAKTWCPASTGPASDNRSELDHNP